MCNVPLGIPWADERRRMMINEAKMMKEFAYLDEIIAKLREEAQVLKDAIAENCLEHCSVGRNGLSGIRDCSRDVCHLWPHRPVADERRDQDGE